VEDADGARVHSVKMPRVLPTLVLFAAGAAAVLSAAGAADERELHLSKFNHVYSDLAGQLAPLEAPPVTVQLASSHQTILVKDNVVKLRPLGGGRFAGSLSVNVLGKGDVTADVDFGGGASQRLNDELLVPPQWVEVAGIVRMSRAQGGYRIVTEQLPKTVKVAIRSHLVGQLLQVCSGASLLTLGSLDCNPVADELENPALPLPAPGSEFFLADADLTANDRQALDELLASR
jgi:hypothetical protein